MDAPTFFKKINYTWKRFRRRLKKQPTKKELSEKVPRLKALIRLQQRDLIDVYFADESGFNLQPNVPYGWQPIGEQLAFPSHKKQVLNTFGLLNVVNKHLVTYSTKPKQVVNSDFICQSLNDFATKITQQTVVILDNAPWHKSEQFFNQISVWQDQGLFIFHLPRYCPHLNLIETLWRKIKYEWLTATDYNSETALKRKLKSIYANFGNLFDIDFSMNFYS